MNTLDWQRIKDVFHQALVCDPAKRAALIDDMCADDEAIKKEVFELLQAHDTDHGFMKAPTLTGGLELHATDEPPGTDIGPYRIVEKIGTGGFGVVYRAEQSEPVRRTVALKVIKLGMDTERVMSLFAMERQTLAMMDHPSIARVFDAGATDSGRPYFAMELVDGLTITDFCDQHKLETRERLGLFIKVCQAIQHAHQKGVIHRDIKPSNVLVTEQDGEPVPKIIDFGIARATDAEAAERTVFTEHGLMIGTPSYMSPEQARLSRKEIDTRSDVYSLGVLLYELLTGTTPFAGEELRQAGLDELQRIICEQEPNKPSTRVSQLRAGSSIIGAPGLTPKTAAGVAPNADLVGVASATSVDDTRTIQFIADHRRTDPGSLMRLLRGDLDWIVMKALEKQPERRYDSAGALGMDVQRHLRDEPVEAGPPSALYRLRKFTRKNRSLVAGLSILLVGLLTFAIVVAVMYRRAEDARALAQKSATELEAREKELVESRDELQKVVDFQSLMLSGINTQQMGITIVDDIKAAIIDDHQSNGHSPQDLQSALKAFEESMQGINPTNIALNAIDKHVLVRSIDTLNNDFQEKPSIRAALLQSIARVYYELGLHQNSIPLQAAAYEANREAFGAESPETLYSLHSLAVYYASIAEFVKAESVLKELLMVCRRKLGPEHSTTLEALDDLGNALRSQGKLAEAEPYYREALEGNIKASGRDSPETLKSAMHLGQWLNDMGRPADAEPYYREAMEGLSRVLGENDSATLRATNNLAMLLQQLGDLDTAAALLTDVLIHQRRQLGDNHKSTLRTLNNLGLVSYKLGRWNEAERCFHEALERKMQEFGPEDPTTITALNNFGSMLVEIDKGVEARPYLIEAIDRARRVFGEQHLSTIDIIGNVANAFRQSDDAAGAERLFREALALADHSEYHDHPITLRIHTNFSKLLIATERPKEAEEHGRNAVDGLRRILGEDHPTTLEAMHNLSQLLRESGRIEEAEAIEGDVLERARIVLSPTHPFVCATLSEHGNLLLRLSRFDEAEPELLEAMECERAQPPTQTARLTRATQNMVELYLAWTKPERAAEWQARLDKREAQAEAEGMEGSEPEGDDGVGEGAVGDGG